VPKDGPGWYVDVPIDGDGDLRLRARGVGESARQLIAYMAHRAQRRAGILEARVSSVQSLMGPGARVNHLMRQATLGALTSSLLHDLASHMQTLSVALSEVSMLGEAQVPGLADAVADANSAGEEAVQLFVQMRKFIRAGEVAKRPVRIDKIL